MSKEIYEVLEVAGKPGLTVGSDVLKPGQRFSREQWPYPQKNLDVALKEKRCKKVSIDSKPGTAPAQKTRKELNLEGMELQYSKIEDLKSPEAIKLFNKIENLKAEINK